eukprot:Nk52_evm9s1224 gene=Nk52_evmTU9s1224
MSFTLSSGAVKAIHAEQPCSEPILQVLSAKGMQNKSGNGAMTERFRLVLSDGVHYQQAMLGTQLNDLVKTEQLKKLSVFKLKNFVCNAVQNKKIVIVLEVEIIASDVQEKIGSPSNIEIQATSADQPPAAPERGMPQNQPQQQQPQQQQQQYQHRPQEAFNNAPSASYGGAMTPSGTTTFCSVDGINPYLNRWALKVRVTTKGDIRTWSNQNGDGKLFSFECADSSGSIKVTAFKEQCEKFYPMIEMNKVYTIKNGQVKMANKKFSNSSAMYEINLDRNSVITPMADDGLVPQVKYNFVPIKELEGREANSIVDVIGVLSEVGELNEIMSKTKNNPIKKKDVTLVDQSAKEVGLTLWAKQAENFEGKPGDVVSVKDARISEWNGVSLGGGGATILINPDFKESHVLKGWYDSVGQSIQTTSFTRKTGGMKTERMFFEGTSAINGSELEKPIYFTNKGTITVLKSDRNYSYPSCSKECKKKITETSGQWFCEKCQENRSRPVYRYVLNLSAADSTSQCWLTLFDEEANKVLGHSADELAYMKANGDDMRHDEVFANACFKQFLFTVRGKGETYNDEMKMRYTVTSAVPLDFKTETRFCLDKVKELEAR